VKRRIQQVQPYVVRSRGLRHVVLDLDGTPTGAIVSSMPRFLSGEAAIVEHRLYVSDKHTSRSKADYVASCESSASRPPKARFIRRPIRRFATCANICRGPKRSRSWARRRSVGSLRGRLSRHLGLAAAVVVGFDTTLTYERLCRAAFWISTGLPFIATHPDLVCPTDEPTVLVDCGAICACLTAATRRSPLVLGKPDPSILLDLCARHGLAPRQLASVGDRIYTDMALAQKLLAGRAGSERRGDGSRRRALPQPPDLVVQDVGELGRRMEEARRGPTSR